MDPVEFLQAWYQAQSNGHWELSHGITIESLGNPGWLVTIDLDGTPLEDRAMTAIERDVSKLDWLSCGVNRKQFRGQGDPKKLQAIMRIFQTWAETESARAESATGD